MNALIAGFVPGRAPVDNAAVKSFQNNVEEALEAIARFLETPSEPPPEWDGIRKRLDQIQFRGAPGNDGADWIASRLEHVATEVEGMLFGAQALVQPTP